jgi:hypothetical protein
MSHNVAWGQKPPRPLGPLDQDSQHLLTALELLRRWAYLLSEDRVHAQWCSLGLGGNATVKKVLHLDAPTDWHTTLQLGLDAVELRSDLETFKMHHADMPDLPSALGWHNIKVNTKILGHLRACSSILETDAFRAAQVLPVYVSYEKGLDRLHAKACT